MSTAGCLEGAWSTRVASSSLLPRTGHEHGLSKKTLEKMDEARCFETDHILGCNCDGSPNFFFMFQSINNQFSFQTLQQFKKFYTGTAWDGIVSYVDKAYQMQWSYGRRF